MKRLLYAAVFAAMPLGLVACGDYDENQAYENQAYENQGNGAYGAGEGDSYGTGGGNAGYANQTGTAAVIWPSGARIVEEGGVTYRIDPGGARVRLAPNESRIVVEDNVRFRVDPDGTRVRIDPQGAEIEVDDADAPSLEVDTNRQ